MSTADTSPKPSGPIHGAQKKLTLISPVEFFDVVGVNYSDGVQAVVFEGSNGDINEHHWCSLGTEFSSWASEKVQGRKPAYFSMASFNPEVVRRYSGRSKVNAVAMRGICFDIEGSLDKYKKPGGPDGCYPDRDAAMKAVTKFVRAYLLVPNLVVLTGSGGVHLHWVFSEPVAPSEWLPLAKKMVSLAQLNGLKIDSQCTTDAARIMRAPGSVHQKTGVEVKAYRWRLNPYGMDELIQLQNPEPLHQAPDRLGADQTAELEAPIARGDAVLGAYPDYSYTMAAVKCAAMREAALHGGRDTQYRVWLIAVRAAALATEGRILAHSISAGHDGYDAASTDKKIESLSGGPAGCDAWANAYGTGGPCDSCDYRGKIKNPAVQLGSLVDKSPTGNLALIDQVSVPYWVTDLNARYGLVRIGKSVLIADRQTSSMSDRGPIYGIGFLEVSAFRTLLSGQFAPPQMPSEKRQSLASAWLSHPQRAQYEGMVFAPGEALPDNILNLWQGFAVEPVAGDVSLWLELLAALVPNEVDRRYVLHWLAWKIKYPGGVPDTILIFKGAKGTGKNSLFDPLIHLFGRHAMLADDPELIAGRFTGHLMNISFAVLDEAVFIGDPKQAYRIKSRVTAKTMQYDQKGIEAVQGVNRCAYVMLTNHEHVWQATNDERRSVVIEAGVGLRGNFDFFDHYHSWVKQDGPSALLHHLQCVDLKGFNPRVIPRGEALRQQVELTALSTPGLAWWLECLTDGTVFYRDDAAGYRLELHELEETKTQRHCLRLSYEQSAASRGHYRSDWSSVSKKLKVWTGGLIRNIRVREGSRREWFYLLPSLPVLRKCFTAATQVEVPND